MNKSDVIIGNEMFTLIKKLFPICRSITGNGVRDTLEIIKEKIPLTIMEIPSGTKVFDWNVPKEWNINNAYVKDSNGKKIIDFQKSNLHVLNYSTPIHKKISFSELKKHLFTLPNFPDKIPYLTSYYVENWGFCISQNHLEKLQNGLYEVFIDSTLKDGSLTYGELYLPGKNKDEILFTTYLCHPSMCNDNLSGLSLLVFLAKQMMNKTLNYSYRFLFIPETIGAITWLNINEDKVSQIKQGLVATCLGDCGHSTYKKTKNGNTIIDKIVLKVLKESSFPFRVIDFFPFGSDERQFSSPGFNLNVGSLMRTPYGQFDEYHTSGDNLDFIKSEFLQDSFEKYSKIVEFLEVENTINDKKTNNISNLFDHSTRSEIRYMSLNPKCEPQLGKRGLYRMIGGQKEHDFDDVSIFWILCFSDGNFTLNEISHRSGINFEKLKKTANLLCEKNLLKLVT
jgi:aminopeptidase-like protein